MGCSRWRTTTIPRAVPSRSAYAPTATESFTALSVWDGNLSFPANGTAFTFNGTIEGIEPCSNIPIANITTNQTFSVDSLTSSPGVTIGGGSPIGVLGANLTPTSIALIDPDGEDTTDSFVSLQGNLAFPQLANLSLPVSGTNYRRDQPQYQHTRIDTGRGHHRLKLPGFRCRFHRCRAFRQLFDQLRRLPVQRVSQPHHIVRRLLRFRIPGYDELGRSRGRKQWIGHGPVRDAFQQYFHLRPQHRRRQPGTDLPDVERRRRVFDRIGKHQRIDQFRRLLIPGVVRLWHRARRRHRQRESVESRRHAEWIRDCQWPDDDGLERRVAIRRRHGEPPPPSSRLRTGTSPSDRRMRASRSKAPSERQTTPAWSSRGET